MTALDRTRELMGLWHAGIVAAYLDGNVTGQEALARDVLQRLGIEATAASLPAADEERVRLGLDVVMWRYVEGQAGLLFDFSADGGSFHRSQLATNAARMRRKAEDAAEWANLAGFGYPPVVVSRLVHPEDVDEWV